MGIAAAALARRAWSPATRLAVAARVAAGPSLAVAAVAPSSSSGACVGSRVAASWGGHGRGYASNVFQNQNSRLKAVAEASETSGGKEAAAVEVVAPPIKLLTSAESEDLLKIRHTTAHICAMATQKLFPNAQCTIGPWSVLALRHST